VTNYFNRGSERVPSKALSVHVLAAVIWQEGAVLLAQRPEHKRHGGLWEFPGGKLEFAEDYLECLSKPLGRFVPDVSFGHEALSL
jgi:8-oxo-dGTP diphosphatase